MHARDYTQSKKLIWIWRRKIYISMLCAQNAYATAKSDCEDAERASVAGGTCRHHQPTMRPLTDLDPAVCDYVSIFSCPDSRSSGFGSIRDSFPCHSDVYSELHLCPHACPGYHHVCTARARATGGLQVKTHVPAGVVDGLQTVVTVAARGGDVAVICVGGMHRECVCASSVDATGEK